jgi:hypothetical protein
MSEHLQQDRGRGFTGFEAEVPGWRTISSFGFERIRLQLADGREKRFGLGKWRPVRPKSGPPEVC